MQQTPSHPTGIKEDSGMTLEVSGGSQVRTELPASPELGKTR